ncbi:regulator of G-protein signaling loco-like [Lucilia sericata]|uniref:regulator of G-protein signaling loco-like n=1 Tax=Lucilia sericata TaxID=13632 RepID=UPI0018A81EF3|nr:regulator of G-protein signaling loco-like [Lucilia sericata]
MHHHHPHNTTSPAAAVTNSSTTQPPTQRRRKKRPNYGTRTVEVRRGYSGFGFTISGQQPCRLSCIIPNSPADQAGLRAGDCLISVNGSNVSKLPHETVVQLIGNSFGSIRMQIAEHYYSDSTDEENAATGSPAIPSLGPYRPRYVYHKNKQQRMKNSPMKKYESLLPLPRTTQPSKKCPLNTVKKPLGAEVKVTATKRPLSEELKPSLAACSSSTVANVRAMVRAPLTSAALEYRAVVGYLGTIEMPKQISHSSKLQTVRSCIRKLRQEKRTPSTVLMVILPDCLKLLSNTGNVMATYASSRLNYVSSSSESENRFFGLVTSAVYSSPPEENDDEEDALNVATHSSNTDHISISNSCHVFVVDTKLCDHAQHLAKAQEFRIECTKDPISSLCLEFPNNSEYVVNLIRSMYTMRIIPPATQRSMSDDPNLHAGGRHHNATAHSPQPSNHSEISTTTSNSDSGIGYNNDCTNITDRIVVVDFPQQRSQATIHAALNVGHQRPHNICQQDIQEDIASTSSLAANKRLTVRAMPDPKIPYILNSPVRCLLTSRSCDDVLNLLEQEAENYDNDQEALTTMPQQCYASMDDISLHATQTAEEEEHQFLKPLNKTDTSQEENSQEPLTQSLEDKKKQLKLQFDTWNSLQNLSCQSAEIVLSSPDKLASTPDLSKIEVSTTTSPFERGWIQTSLRTPRADKHTLQFSLTPETKTNKRPEISTVCRSGSLTNSDVERNSLNYGNSSNDLTKPLPKGPTAWGTSIEVLLADPAGIKSFAEFLKLEYAAENIYFWTACERFRNMENPAERQAEALIIYTKHLSNGSFEPVNVDSKARSLVEQNLSNAEKNLFHPAQKQIFNLMKFDCYQRFLKSDLYKQCLQAEKKGKPLPYTGENLDELLKTTNFSESASSKLKKSASNAEEGRRRRSLLPWHRKANHARSKSRDRIAIEKSNQENAAAIPTTKSLLTPNYAISKSTQSIHGSKTSLASIEAIPVGELNNNFCRVKFPDGSTSVIQLKSEETVAQLVERLFEKRNLNYQFYDVSITGPPQKGVELQSLAQELSRKEIEIEQRVAFKLELPTPKVISVKCKPKKQLYEVVRPILQRYNINPEIVEVLMKDTQEKVDLTQLVTHIDNQRLQVVLKKTYPPLPQAIQNRKPYAQSKNSIINGLQTAQSALDEITNNVFSDLMDVKNQDVSTKPAKLDQCSLKSEECNSESSSFLKRIRNGKKNEDILGMSLIKSKKSLPVTTAAVAECKLAIKEKIKAGVKQQFPSKVAEKQDDLLEDLKRAQLARLEDQRGTEINFELPEFLKNTDNLNSSSSSSNNNENSINTTTVERPPQPAPRLSIINPNKTKPSSISPMKIEEDQNSTEDIEDLNTSLKGPPPLPPKPKVLPIKPSNWGVNISQHNKTSPLPTPTINNNNKLTNANVAAISSNNVIVSPSARCAYLDQPSSSFV